MKQYIIIAIMAIATMALASCTDPVHGTKPVSRAFFTDAQGETNFPLSDFHKYGKAGDTLKQRELVNEYRKILTANVARQYPKVTNPSNIHFILGSGFAKDVQSGDGRNHDGPFKNELIIIIDDPAVKDTVFLACGNGMLSPLRFKSQSDFGTAERWRIVVEEGKSLAYYIPKLEEWGKVASDFGIVILKDGKPVSQEVYMNDPEQCKSLLFKNDVIDFAQQCVFNERGQQVDFERRMQETREANARIAAAQRAKAKRRR